jgi:5-methylcytosine-specific restriction endonuclease McrA
MTIGHPFATRRGRKIRRSYLDERPLCEPCRRKGFVIKAVEVHHIRPVETHPGLGLDPDNFESRCDECHKRAHGARIKGCKADGTPNDPEHPWNR